MRFIRQFLEYTLVAAFFMGIPAMAALGPRLKFMAHAAKPAHQRTRPESTRPVRLAVKKLVMDSMKVGEPAAPVPRAGYSFGPETEALAQRGQIERGR